MSRWLPLVLLTFGCLRNLETTDDHGLVEPASTGSSTTDGSSTTAAGESSSSGEGSSSEGSAGAEASSGTTTGGATGESTGDPPGTTTTDEPAPFCGDGVVNSSAEECDEGELETESCFLCQRVRLIFVTSILLQGGKINGLVGADAYCKSLANTAKNELPDSPIVDPGNFKALLATSTAGLERHFIGKGPYRLVNGLRVSQSFAGLFNEPLEHPINVDERSQTMSATVYTGFDVDGEPYPGIDFCGDWTDFNGTCNYGYSEAVDSWWVHLENDLNPAGCGSFRPIYCVEQE